LNNETQDAIVFVKKGNINEIISHHPNRRTKKM